MDLGFSGKFETSPENKDARRRKAFKRFSTAAFEEMCRMRQVVQSGTPTGVRLLSYVLPSRLFESSFECPSHGRLDVSVTC